MSFVELLDDPRREWLMTTAFTCEAGEQNGELMRQQNPEYWRQVKAAAEQVKKARGD